MVDVNDYISKLLSIAQNDESADPVFVRISQVMLTHLRDLGKLQNQQLAKMCYVNASTISRFVKSLGFVNYVEFKDYFEEYNRLHGIKYYFHYDKMDNQSGKKLMESAAESLKDSFAKLDMQALEKVADLIEQYDEIILCGDRFSQLAAEDFQFRLLSLGYYAKTFKDVSLQQEYLIKHQGLMILFSASLGLAKLHVAEAKKHHWKIAVISRSQEAKDISDVYLLYDDKHLSDWTIHSVNDRYCMYFLIDQLIFLLASRKKLQDLQ